MFEPENKKEYTVTNSISRETREVRKMTPEQIHARKRTTINNLAERQMFGIQKNYKIIKKS